MMSNAGADGSCGSKFKLRYAVLQVYLSWHASMQVCTARLTACAVLLPRDTSCNIV